MGLDKVNFALSNVNMLLSSGLNYVQDKQAGDTSGAAEMNLGGNLINGAVRNTIAYDMRRTYGSNLGFLVNNLAGYGTPEANAKGTMGLMGASLFTGLMNPFGYGYGCGMPMFGMSMPMMPMLGGFSGFSAFGGGFCGPSVFGGGCFGGHNVNMHGGRNTFIQNNYYC